MYLLDVERMLHSDLTPPRSGLPGLRHPSGSTRGTKKSKGSVLRGDLSLRPTSPVIVTKRSPHGSRKLLRRLSRLEGLRDAAPDTRLVLSQPEVLTQMIYKDKAALQANHVHRLVA